MNGLILMIGFPVVFLIHELEEIIYQREWMLDHYEELEERFPKAKPIIEYLLKLNTKAFALAAFEEFVIIFLTSSPEKEIIPYGGYIWPAVFMAFSLHLFVHVILGIVIRGYVPGLVTSILFTPGACWGINNFCLIGGSYSTLAIYTISGVVFMLLNLLFAHWIGRMVFGDCQD